MSASKAAEMLVHHTQAASYHQGCARTYAEAMRLVRQVKQQANNLPMAEVIAALDRMENTFYAEAQANERRVAQHNAALREASEALVTADHTISGR